MRSCEKNGDMNKSILIAGGLIAGAILLQPIVERLVVKQTTICTDICTETGVRKVSNERNTKVEKSRHKGFGAEPPRSKGKLYEMNAPIKIDIQAQKGEQEKD